MIVNQTQLLSLNTSIIQQVQNVEHRRVINFESFKYPITDKKYPIRDKNMGKFNRQMAVSS